MSTVTASHAEADIEGAPLVKGKFSCQNAIAGGQGSGDMKNDDVANIMPPRPPLQTTEPKA